MSGKTELPLETVNPTAMSPFLSWATPGPGLHPRVGDQVHFVPGASTEPPSCDPRRVALLRSSQNPSLTDCAGGDWCVYAEGVVGGRRRGRPRPRCTPRDRAERLPSGQRPVVQAALEQRPRKEHLGSVPLGWSAGEGEGEGEEAAVDLKGPRQDEPCGGVLEDGGLDLEEHGGPVGDRVQAKLAGEEVAGLVGQRPCSWMLSKCSSSASMASRRSWVDPINDRWTRS